MKTTEKGKTSDIEFLGSMTHDSTSLRGRIAVITYQNLSHSHLADKIMVLIEHLQSSLLFLISNYRIFAVKNHVSVNIITGVFSTLSSINPASYVGLKKEHTERMLVMALIAFLVFLFRMAVFGYIVIIAMKRKSPSKNIQLIWQWIFKLQPRVMYFLFAPIWTNLIEGTVFEFLDLAQGTNIFLKYVSIIMFALEFSFSLALQTQFTCILPNKSFLSSKNNITQILTLLQKFLNQLIRRAFYFAPRALIWAANIIILMLSGTRLFCYFYYLPYYKVGCLFYELYFIVIVFALNIVCLLQVIFGDNIIDLNLVIGIWFVLSGLLLKISVAYLKNKLEKMALLNKEAPPEVLIHKVIAAKYFLKGEKGWRHLVKVSLCENTEKVFGISGSSVIDVRNKDSRNRLFSIYLDKLLLEFPKNDFVRLYAAYHFAKKQRLYGKSMRTIHELRRWNSWNNDASASIIFQEMKHKIISESRDHTFLFDTSEFIQCTSFFAQVKIQILKQMELQEMIYKEMKQFSPLLIKLSKLGNQVVKIKQQIEADRKEFFQVMPEYYLEPLLLYAHYYLVLNHSYETFLQFHAMYSSRHQKYAKIFNLDNFCQENFFKKNTGFLVLSGEKQTPGKVLNCGGNYMEIFGRNISGQYCGAAVPTVTAMDPRVLFNSILENGEVSTLNKLQKRHFYHQNGFMTQVEYFFNVSPYLSQGLTYYVVFRSVKTFEECILINREGFIESFTKGIGEKLNLCSQVAAIEEKNIERICPELQLANEAFNIIAQPAVQKKARTPDTVNVKTKGKSFFVKKGPMMSREEAQDICSSYEDGTHIVHLEGKCGTKFAYRCCKIVAFPNNAYGAKEIYLERIIEKTSKGTLGEITRVMDDNSHGTLPERRRDSIRPFEWNDECPDTYENEKELGWINFQTLEGNNCKTTSPDMNFPTLQSPRSSTSRQQLISARSNKPPPSHLTRRTRTFTAGSSPYPNFESVVTEDGKAQEIESFSNALSRQESVFSLKSEFVARSKIKKQRVFEQANLATYILPKYKVLTGVLFFVMGTVFLLQQILNFSIRNGFNDLDANKEIVLVSELRNYYFSFLNVVICFIYGEAANIFQISDLVPGLNLVVFKGFLHQAIGNLTSTNSQLFGIANSLNDAQRQILFQRDVKIYLDDVNYDTFTTFQAVNQMVETSLRVESEMLVNVTNTYDDLYFIGNNLLHDLSIKGNQITDQFFENLQERKDSFLQSLLITFLSITIIPIGGLMVANSFVFAQYKVDLSNMLAFTKINKQTVEHTLTNLTHFKLFLQQNTNFEETLKEEQYMQLLKNNIENYKNLKNQAADNLQSPDPKGFTKPYFWLSWMVFVILLQVTLSFLIYYSIFTKNLKNLGNKAYQLYFLDRTASKIIALRSGTFEMVLLNDTGHVFNDVTSVFVAKQIAELEDVQDDLQKIFSSGGSENNELVQNIMFDDACTYLKGQATTYSYCKKLANYQNKASWINLISNIRQLYENYLLKYLASDKSSSTLLHLQKDFVRNIMTPTLSVSTALSTLLNNSINAEFTKLNDDSEAWNNRMPFLYLIVIIISIRMGLWNVIWPLNDMEMKFRQLLLLFPANVVLSNFMLKSYLLKVSRGAFDSIRNEI